MYPKVPGMCFKTIIRSDNRSQVLMGMRGSDEVQPKAHVYRVFFNPSLPLFELSWSGSPDEIMINLEFNFVIFKS